MKIRTKCPKNNKYYIRKVTGGLNGAVAGEPTQPYANVLDNCVGYANGRYNESINDPDLKGVVKAFKYQLTCNAENFIESAKRQGLKISSTPIEGGIMVWQKGRTLNGGDGAGHVAFVERVYDDGTILTSESGWDSWAFKTVRRNNSNGRWGQNENYKFRGCIINPSIKNPKVVPVPPLTVDGIGGTCTVRAMQRFFGTTQDGVISGQNKTLNKFYPALKAVEYGKGGSPCIKKLQKWVGVTQNGIIGENTVKAWQKKIGVDADGIFGAEDMKVWQKYLNEHKKAVYPIEAENSIGKLANKYAWGIDDADKAKYPSGSPTDAYKAGLDKAYPNRSSWGVSPSKGASCDVFVGTCVRNAGVDKNFPRGLDDQITHLAKSAKFKEVSVTVDTVKDGDIIVYTKTSGGGHICIACGGKVKEAGFEHYYPKTTNTLKSRLSKSGKKWIKVYRVVSDQKKTYKIIDVSDWQGQINWKKVKANGIVGAIIRYADGDVLDKRFSENMKNAKAAGLHIGSYIFSRAKTKAEAENEAERLYKATKKYEPDMPLYIDLEVASLAKYANVVAQAFLNKMKALGGRGGVYANLNWWNNYLVDTAKNYSASPFWIAQYNDTMDYKPASAMGMWQYTSSGNVNGINGKVDRDKCYVAYWDAGK